MTILSKTMPDRSRWGDLLERELLPGLEPYIRRWRSPLGCLAASAVAAALCGLVLHPRGFVALAGILAVIGLGALWPWLGLIGLRGRLAFDSSRGREGEPVGVSLNLRNRSPLGAWDLGVDGLAGDGSSGAGHSAPGWQTSEASWSFVPGCRGEYPRGRARLVTAFPFGIRKASRTLEVPSPLVVWPRTYPVAAIPAVAGRSDVGTALRNQAGHSGDVIGVRPYRRGDSLRRVHWSQTARLGELVVCEEQALGTPLVQIVLDTDLESHCEGPDSSLEWAVRVAASFVEGWMASGAEVELIARGKDLTPRGRDVRTRLARTLDALARLDPVGSPSLSEVLTLPCCQRPHAGLRVVITTDIGVRALGERGRSGAAERFVVLRSAGFAPGGAENHSGAGRAWIWIGGPDEVARRLRGGGEEVARDS